LAFFGAASAKMINSLGTVSVSQMCAIGVDPSTLKIPFIPQNYNKVNSTVVPSEGPTDLIVSADAELIVEEIQIPAVK
jgi:hypothetical protein